MKKFLSGLVVLIFITACEGGGENLFEQENEKLLFNSKIGGIEQLYIRFSDGTVKALNSGNQKAGSASISPDGKEIVFINEDEGKWNIHLMNLKTLENKVLVESEFIEGYPTWSPDGRLIAYMSNIDNNRDIYAVNADGSGTKRITDHGHIDLEPVWSSSQEGLIYFKSLRDNYEGVYAVDINNLETAEISPRGGANRMVKNTPSGGLTYARASGAQSNLMYYDPLNQKTFSLLSTPEKISAYDWSKDGKKVAVAIGNNIEVFNYDETSGLIGDFVISDASGPEWTSKGDLYFVRRLNNIQQIFKFDSDDFTSQQLTFGEADSYNPQEL